MRLVTRIGVLIALWILSGILVCLPLRNEHIEFECEWIPLDFTNAQIDWINSFQTSAIRFFSWKKCWIHNIENVLYRRNPYWVAILEHFHEIIKICICCTNYGHYANRSNRKIIKVKRKGHAEGEIKCTSGMSMFHKRNVRLIDEQLIRWVHLRSFVTIKTISTRPYFDL